MLDLTGIMFSTIMIVLVVLRALEFDRSAPWFETVRDATRAKDDETAEGARRERPSWRKRKS